MHEAVISEIKQRLNLLFSTDTQFFCRIVAGKDFESFPVSEDNFGELVKKAIGGDSCIDYTYVDGGNNTLFSSTSFTLVAIRICAYSLSGGSKTYSFFLIVQQQKKGFEISLVPSDVVSETFMELFKYPTTVFLNDAEFMRGGGKVETQSIVNLIRRLLELYCAKDYDAVVIDGSLETKYAAEQELVDSFYATNKHIVGISKTTSLVTENGVPAGLYVSRLAPCKSWVVSDVLKSGTVQICFTKLHKRSKYVFRIDVPLYLKPRDVCLDLAVVSTDATFLGYPYGLIRVDELARISEDELQFMRNRFLSSLDPLTRSQLEQIRTTQSAHSVLDSMKF